MSIGPVGSGAVSDTFDSTPRPVAPEAEPAASAQHSPAVSVSLSGGNPVETALRSALDALKAYQDLGDQHRFTPRSEERQPQIVDASLLQETQQLQALQTRQQLESQRYTIANQRPASALGLFR